MKRLWRMSEIKIKLICSITYSCMRGEVLNAFAYLQ